MTGTIQMLDNERRFGFIRGPLGRDYFFHASTCEVPFDNLRKGQSVKFEDQESERGPRACSVCPA